MKIQSVFIKHIDTDSGHGRIETRHCSVYKNLNLVEKPDQWKSLKTIVRIDSEIFVKSTGKTEHQTRYYISSLDDTAKNFNNWIRSQWGIENILHWVLDVTFKEDYLRKRQGFAAENINTILKIAMTLLANNNSIKASKKRKCLKAALNQSYREELLNF